MRNYTLELRNAGISRERYMELKYQCLQYDQMKKRTQDMRKAANAIAEMDEEARKRFRRRLLRRLELIEECAREVSPEMAPWLLGCVTREKSELPPCGPRQYYEMRRRFYVLLDRKLQGED